MDIRDHNRAAWDRQVEVGNPWTVRVSPRQVAEAREGRWDIYLTPSRPVPRDWFRRCGTRRCFAWPRAGDSRGRCWLPPAPG